MADKDRHMHFLRQAIALSDRIMREGKGGPFGAIIVRDDQILAEGYNQVTPSIDPTAHAEICAIRAACQKIGDFRLNGAILYSSCEPCPMCLAAVYWARIDAVFYANSRADAAAIGFDDAHIYEQLAKPITQRQLPMTHLPMDEARKVFTRWQADPTKIRY